MGGDEELLAPLELPEVEAEDESRGELSIDVEVAKPLEGGRPDVRLRAGLRLKL